MTCLRQPKRSRPVYSKPFATSLPRFAVAAAQGVQHCPTAARGFRVALLTGLGYRCSQGFCWVGCGARPGQVWNVTAMLQRTRRLWTGLALLGALVGPLLQAQVITDFSPAFGQPGTWVTLYGTGFYYTGTAVDPVAAVQFGTRPAQFSVTADNQLVAVVPAGATTDYIRIAKQGRGWVYSPRPFTVIGPGPYITGFSPTHGNVGTLVRIEGVQFTGATTVQFNGVPAAGFFVASDTLIEVNVPAGASTGPIAVGRAGVGTNVSAGSFYLPPTIERFDPTNGQPGTLVSVYGKNLRGTTDVRFNGMSASFETPTTNTILRAVVPAGARTGPIQVTTPGGVSFSFASFTVQPSLTRFSPAAGPPGTVVILEGSNLDVDPVTVRFGEATATISQKSFDRLTVTVPAGATTGPIRVTTRDGSAASTDLFYLPPHITGFTPSNGPVGTAVTISGQNLLGTTAVLFNGLATTFLTPTSNTALMAYVPAGVTTGPLTVVTPGGSTNTGSRWFYAAPAIQSFSPVRGLPGTNVVITGTNFLGTTAVRFNGVSASFQPPTNNTTLVATVPAGAQTGPIEVVTPGGQAFSETPFVLDYTSDLRLEVASRVLQSWPGSNITATLGLRNLGPYLATNVVFEAEWPAALQLRSASASMGSVQVDGNRVRLSLPSLSQFNPVSVTLTWTAQQTGWFTNQARLTSTYTDPSPDDAQLALAIWVEPLPLLSIQALPHRRVRVAWPVALTNHVLQYRPVAGPAQPWTDHPVAPTISGGERVVIETNHPAGRLFRLRR